MATQIIAQPIGVAMATAKYKTKAEYVAAIHALHQRAKRSGWDIGTAPKHRIASWLSINPYILEDRNRAYGISIDDIRTDQLIRPGTSDD
jgi:hypothetical protein